MKLQTALFFFIVAVSKPSTTKAFATLSTRTPAFSKSTSSSRSPGSSTSSLAMSSTEERYTIPDQPARYARAKAENNQRYLDITTAYDPSYIKGKRVAVTGANRGVGLSLSKELVKQGAKLVAIVRKSSAELDALKPDEIISGVEATNDEACASIPDKIKGGPIDILINNAGYFYEPVEKLDCMNFAEQVKTIDICAVGPLRVSTAIYNANLFTPNSSVIAMITSQGGSVSWRPVQSEDGGDYGHHMSKAAANMGSVLLAQELKKKGIAVGILHPGFNKTDMTKKYEHIWEIEGAVDAECGAMRVIHEIGNINMETSGKFVNCEDGLEIPW